MGHVEILQNKLLLKKERIEDIMNNLPPELSEIKSTDSSGRDEMDLFGISTSLAEKFKDLAAELDAPFKIAVVGSQGTGKSTLVNLLLGEALMPSTALENESAVIKLTYPPEDSLVNQAVFELMDNTTITKSIAEAIKLIDKKERDQQRDSEDESFVKNIKYVTFYIKSEKLQSMELVNTPGMNVITEDFYPKVSHLFTQADVVIWVNSAEQILDEFNSWLIKKIHADNNKIVGLITFPDKLYRQDENSGVTDVVTQFMEDLEQQKLLRVDGQIGLFIFNGIFAQIAESQKSTAKFNNDVNNLEDDEPKLRMLYNFLHHGFAYSDDAANYEILRDYGLYGLESIQQSSLIDEDFDLQTFYQYCIKEGFCVPDEQGATASYTEKGLMLLREASQYNSFGRFADNILLPMSKDNKMISVEEKLNRILSESDSKDTPLSRLLQIKNILEIKKQELGDEDQSDLRVFEEMMTVLKTEYKNWYESQLPNAKNHYGDKLADTISYAIEEKINPVDFMKEIGRSLKPKFLRSGESAVSEKITQIVTESVGYILPLTLEKLANDASEQVELILIKMRKDFAAQNAEFSPGTQNFQLNSKLDLKFNVAKILEKILIELAPLLQKMLLKIAATDLRKGANTFMKTNLVKPVVKLIRQLLQKIGKDFVTKQAVNAGAKAGMGPVGWTLLAIDLIKTGHDMHKMYKEMKATLKDKLKNEESFKQAFEDDASSLFKTIIGEVEKTLAGEFTANRKDFSFILTGISAAAAVREEVMELSANTMEPELN